MRIPTAVVSGLLAVSLLGACSDDEEPVATGDDTATTEPDGADITDGDFGTAPDLVGTITGVEPFTPITEDCTPAEDLDPNEPVSSDDPPVCTPEDNDILGTILVEENPGDTAAGRKISFTVTVDSGIYRQVPGGEDVLTFDDLAEGQTVDTWVAGDACAESYPEQCGLEAVRVTG